MKKIVLSLLVVLLSAQIFAVYKLAKADALLQDSYLKYLQNKHTYIPSKYIKVTMNRGEPIFHVFLESSLSKLELERLSIQTQSKAGDIYTAQLTASQLNLALKIDEIKYIEPSILVEQQLDISTSNLTSPGNIGPVFVGNNADSVQNMVNPYRGAGVICSIIDSGINYQHLDFRQNGLTRILNIWDQIATTLPHPIGFTYGREYSSTDINNGTYTQAGESHGTACIGIMAGNGAASPVGRDMSAMAPESDIISVRMTNNQGLYTTYLQDGVAYVFNKAQQYGKPAVVSISLGNNSGPHDGTTLAVQAIDNLCGPGKQVVFACGNSGTQKIHGQYVLPQGQDHIFQIVTANPITTYNPSIGVDFWFEGSDSMDIYITPPGGTELPVIHPKSEREDITAYGIITVMNDIDDPLNGDNRAIVEIEPNNSVLAGGTWSIRFHGNHIVNGKIDGWSYSNVGSFSTVSGGNDFYSLSNLASGHNTIAAAGFAGGSLYLTGILYPGSMGPTRDGRLKPDIAGNQFVQVPNYEGTNTYMDLSSGTSWSAPHVGGAIALLLQKEPTATPQMILDILHNSAVWDEITQSEGSRPNYRVGYGKLNVARAFKQTQPVTTLSIMIDRNDVVLHWTSVPGASNYNIYRSIDPNSGWVRIASLQPGFYYVDISAAAGKRYFYYITTNTGTRSNIQSISNK